MPGSITKGGSVEHVEADERSLKDRDGIDRHLAVRFPDSLVGLSDAEIDAVDRAATRKVDILLIPTLMFLYVLNYLDRQSRYSPEPGASKRAEGDEERPG